MTKLWIEYEADHFSKPLQFATWFVQEGVKTYDEVDDALVAYFKSRGIEEVEELDDAITLRAGVQNIRIPTPLWYKIFADEMGFSVEDWFAAVCELLRLTAEDWSKQDES